MENALATTPTKRGRKSGVSVPRWTLEEEEQLRAAVQKHGERAWSKVVEEMGAVRSKSSIEQHYHIMTGKRKRPVPSPKQGTAGLKSARAASSPNPERPLTTASSPVAASTEKVSITRLKTSLVGCILLPAATLGICYWLWLTYIHSP